jgi:4-diphosphocytidyl-2-C-methyl-D-erythritol kinase
MGRPSSSLSHAMLICRFGPVVRVWAPAKVNLFLEVLARRPDGYHELATLMAAVSLYDTLDFREGPPSDVRLTCDQPDLSTGPDNLVCRAAEALRRRAGLPQGVDIRLRKRIPLAAGLAGGSSDAAATLAGLNALWRLGWRREQLAEIGAEVGSDVSFFFAPSAAWCTGRGERVEPIALGKTLDFVLVCPPVGLSTGQVFRMVTVPSPPLSGDPVRRAAETGDVEELGQLLHNRLQEPAAGLCPAVSDAHSRLAALAPAGVLMSGSGSTVFALCRGPGEARRLKRALAPAMDDGSKTRVHIVRSCF